jgi:hypothetical protein
VKRAREPAPTLRQKTVLTNWASGKNRALCRKRRAAAAGAGGIGVGKLETAAVETGNEVDDRPTKIRGAGAIDVDRYTAELEDHIIRLLLIVEVELIREAGTAAIGNTDTKPVSGTLIARQEFFHLLESAIREL